MIFSLILFANLAWSASPSLEELAQSEQWSRVLYFKQHWVSGWESAVDGEGFFLSPRGKENPLEELKASLEALERGGGSFGKLQQPIDCALPLRKTFLEKALGRKFPSSNCEKLQEFREKLDAKGAAVVFATAYPNNPASMFGHSFLKIYSRKNKSASGALSLLDWSINYAAQVPPDENGFAFAYFGLTGGYQGQFALVPFYSKIEEYGFLEGRDIWEYELNLSEEELKLLVDAIWEIETNSHFDYYFFDENCSLQVLSLLEVVRPDWNLSHYFIHMIPGESIKKVADVPGAVKSVKVRPSLERRLMGMVAALSSEDRDSFNQARAGGEIASLSPPALHAYLLFLQAEKKRLGEKWKSQDRFRAVLLRKSQVAVVEEPKNLGENSRPDLAHGPYQIGVGRFFSRPNSPFNGWELSVKFAYHDLLDPDPGMMPHSEILFPNFKFRWEEKKVRLEEAQIFSIVSLTPWNLVRKPLAWRVEGGYGKLRELQCAHCRGFRTEGGAGAAWGLPAGKVSLWSMLGAQAAVGEAYHGPIVRPWAELGALVTLPWAGKVLVESRTFSPQSDTWMQNWKLGLSQSLHQNWSVRAEGEGVFSWKHSKRAAQEIKVSALHYF